MDSGTPVGLIDIARALGIGRATIYRWAKLGDFPKPNATVNGTTPVWSWGRITQWLQASGRTQALQDGTTDDTGRSADVSPGSAGLGGGGLG